MGNSVKFEVELIQRNRLTCTGSTLTCSDLGKFGVRLKLCDFLVCG